MVHKGKGKEKSLSRVQLSNPMDCSLPGSSSMGFSRQEYWSGVPFPSPGDLPDAGIKPGSPALTLNTSRNLLHDIIDISNLRNIDSLVNK